MSNIGTLTAYVTADITGIVKGSRRAALSVQKMSASISTSLTAAGASVQKFGRTLTIGLTVPIAAAGASIIKLASDAEETSSKFSVVFKDVSREANDMANELTESFGLSSLQSKQLLSNTGDLLTGFGFTGKAALDLSTRVNKLAVDLASFTNVEGGAKRASAALTKALLGERESVKELGITILESDVKAEVLRLTTQGLTFDTERQAKAYATLQIALRQSQNAVGDYARTSGSLANQVRELRARLSDAAVILGTILLPAVNRLVGRMIKLVEAFNKLDPQLRANLVIFAGLVAVLGPTVFLFGKLISLAGFLFGAVGALAGGIALLLTPMGLVVAVLIGMAAIVTKNIGVAQTLGKVWVALRTVFALVLSGIGTVLELAGKAVAKFLKGILILANAVGIDLPDGFSDAIVALNGFSIKMNDFANDQALTALNVSSNWGDAWTQFKTDMREALEFATSFGFEKSAQISKMLTELSKGLQFDGAAAGGFTGGLEESLIEGLGIGMPEEQGQLEQSVTVWQQWLAEQRNIAGVWRDTWAQTAVDVAEGFSQGFADIIVSGRSFASVVTGLAKQVAKDLIAQAVRSAIATIGVQESVTVAKASASAPHPFLIPLFVGLALAAFSGAVGGTKGGSRVSAGVSGGGGGAAAGIESDMGSTVDLTLNLQGGSRVRTAEEEAENTVRIVQDTLLATGGNLGQVKVAIEEV